MLCKQKCALSINDSFSPHTHVHHIHTFSAPNCSYFFRFFKRIRCRRIAHVDVCVNFSPKIAERIGRRGEITHFQVSHISLDGWVIFLLAMDPGQGWRQIVFRDFNNLSIHSSDVFCRSIDQSFAFSCFHFVRFTFSSISFILFPFGMFAQTHARVRVFVPTLNNCYSHTRYVNRIYSDCFEN